MRNCSVSSTGSRNSCAPKSTHSKPDFLRRPFRELTPALKRKREKVKALGLWAPHLPKEHGGLGLTLSEFALVSEELGRTPIGHYLFNCQAPDIGNMEILMAHGTPEQKEKYFAPLARGEVRSCFSMTEPEHPGSNPTWMSTTAMKDGDDYVINGHKWFTSSAEGASFAIVMAITNPESPNPYKRASQIIVPIPDAGISDRAKHQRDGRRRQRLRQSRGSQIRKLPRAAKQLAGQGRRGFCDRAGATRTRKNSSLHALDRYLRARV